MNSRAEIRLTKQQRKKQRYKWSEEDEPKKVEMTWIGYMNGVDPLHSDTHTIDRVYSNF